MNAPQAGPTPAGRGNGNPQGGFSIASIVRMIFFWYVLSNLFKKKAPADPSTLMQNLFHRGDVLDMWVYISESQSFSDFNDDESLIWYETGIPFAEYGSNSKRHLEYTYFPSKSVQHNGTLYAHVFFAKTGFVPDPSDPSYERLFTFNKTHPLIVFRPPPKIVNQHNLLGGSITEQQKKEKEEKEGLEDKMEVIESNRPFVSFFKPNLTIDLVDDFTAYAFDKIPEVIRPHINFDEETGNYFPTVSVTEFWLLKDKLVIMNETVTSLPLYLSVGSLRFWKWQLYISFDKSAELQTTMGTSTDGEMDELKRAFLEGNPILLGVTLCVSILHSVFDFLTFKNDIQFWKENKSMEGLSARTVVLNFFCQLIIFLYLMDNNTSWLIVISSGISVAIEFWKIGKAMNVKIDRSGRFPMLRFSDRDSYKNNKTKEYDEIATRYLSYVLYPLVIAYAIYSLTYESHKSWYSWILSSLTSCVYIFGFIMMCPQLFINYKLKSVAHLPWRQMTYKFLNTIIDDLFAFVIKMPTLHRLSVFRDDIIFLIYIYQRWVYPVDTQRVNEFGFDGEDHGPGKKALNEPTAEASASETSTGTETDSPALTAGSNQISQKRAVGVSEESLNLRARLKETKPEASTGEASKKDD